MGGQFGVSQTKGGQSSGSAMPAETYASLTFVVSLQLSYLVSTTSTRSMSVISDGQTFISRIPSIASKTSGRAIRYIGTRAELEHYCKHLIDLAHRRQAETLCHKVYHVSDVTRTQGESDIRIPECSCGISSLTILLIQKDLVAGKHGKLLLKP